MFFFHYMLIAVFTTHRKHRTQQVFAAAEHIYQAVARQRRGDGIDKRAGQRNRITALTWHILGHGG